MPGAKELRLLPLAFQEHDVAATHAIPGTEFPRLSVLELQLWTVCPAAISEVPNLANFQISPFEPWESSYGDSTFNSRILVRNRKGPGIVVVMAIPRPRALDRILQVR